MVKLRHGGNAACSRNRGALALCPFLRPTRVRKTRATPVRQIGATSKPTFETSIWITALALMLAAKIGGAACTTFSADHDDTYLCPVHVGPVTLLKMASYGGGD